MRRAQVGCPEQIPFRIEPERGKVAEDVIQTVPNKSGDVLKKHSSWSHVVDDSGDVRPEPPLVFDAALLAGGAERLAREARRDEIHDSTPRATAEGGEVIPDRRRIQRAFRHTTGKRAGRIRFSLDVANSSVSGQSQAESKLKPADPGTESQAIHVTIGSRGGVSA